MCENERIMIGRVGATKLGYHHVRCDRNTGSSLSNPFKITDNLSRDGCCELYEEYFKEQILIAGSKVRVGVMRLLRRLKNGDSIFLQCHCTPLRCHTETVKYYLEKELYKNE